MEVKKILIQEFCEDGSFWGSVQYNVLTEMDRISLLSVDEIKKVGCSVARGDMCLVLSSVMGEEKWIRAKVCSILSSREFLKLVELFLVDYGIVDVQPLDKIFKLPVELSEYPPLSLKYFLKDVQPCSSGGLSWTAEVKKSLRKLCGDQRLLVDAVLCGNDLATLYVKNTKSEELHDFNEHLRILGLAKIPVVSSEVQVVKDEVLDRSKDHDWMKVNISGFTEVASRKSAQKNSMVFVQCSEYLDPVSLETSGVPHSFIGELRSIGMSSLTTVQSYSIPFVKGGKNTVIVSPTASGKTLSYLLPLIANIAPNYDLTKPRLIILVSTSRQARSIELQVLKLVSWMADTRIRVACAYYACEVEAYYHLINGVDVLIMTPSSALRLHEKKANIFSEVTCLVLDDYNILCDLFSDEWNQLTQLLEIGKYQLVATGMIWSDNLAILLNVLMDPVIIISCPIEASIKHKVQLEVMPISESVLVSLLSLARSGENILICTSSEEEASNVYQTLQMYSVLPELLTKYSINTFNSDVKKVAILSDEVLLSASTLNIQYRHLLHYSPPKSKYLFRLRLSLLYPSMLKNLQCICTIIGTSKWLKQSLLLEDMFSRLGTSPVQSIIDMSANLKEEREAVNFHRNHDYCYDLKAWGTCRNKKCSSLHKPANKKEDNFDSQLWFFEALTDGYVKMKVSHVSNATRMWVSLVEHTSLKDDKTSLGLHNVVLYKKLSLELTQHYSIPENRAFQANPQEGSYCAYQAEDGLYFRVQVLKFSRPLGFYFPHKERANIRLIDIGIMETVEVSQLLVLPKLFMRLPPQVVEACICAIKPKDNDLDWPREAVDCARKLMHGQVLEGHVAHFFNRILWLDHVEIKKVLTGIHLSTPLYSPAQELIKYELAERNPNHLHSITEVLHSVSREFFDVLNLSPGNKLQVLVTAVDSLSLFYAQAVKNEESVSRLEEVLNTNTVFEQHSDFNVGDLCAAQFPHDKSWYRGQVIAIDQSKYEIFFLDYGDAEWLNSCNVKPIHPSFAKLPFQAIECSLECGGKDLNFKAGDVLWKATRNNTYLIKIICVSRSQVQESTNSYSVTLSAMNSGIDITEILKDYNDGADASDVNTIISSEITENLETLDAPESCSQLFEDQEASNLFQADKPEKKRLHHLIEVTRHSCNDLDVILEEMEGIIIAGFSGTICTSELNKLVEVLLKIVDQVPLAVSLVRVLSGLVMLRCASFNSSNMELVLQGLKSKSLKVVDLTLVLTKLALPDVEFEDVTAVVCLLCCCLKEWRSNRVILEHILDVLLLLTLNESNRMFIFYECWSLVTDTKICETSRRCLLKFLCVISRDMEIEKVLSCLRLCFRENLDNEMVFQILGNMKHMEDSSFLSAHEVGDPLLDCICSMFGKRKTKSISKPKAKKHLHSSSEANESKLCPKVLWTQDETHITLAVQLSGCSLAKVQISGRTILFRATVSITKYEFILVLYDSVSADDFSMKYLMSEVLIKLNKLELLDWPRLIESKEKLSFVNYDISRWTEPENTGFAQSASEYTTLQAEDIPCKHSHDSSDTVEDESDQDDIGDMQFLCDDA